MNEDFCWLTNTGVSMCIIPLEKFIYVFFFTSTTVLNMSGSSYLKDLHNGR